MPTKDKIHPPGVFLFIDMCYLQTAYRAVFPLTLLEPPLSITATLT